MLNDKIILLVEDDPNDVLLIQRAFQKAGLHDTLKVVRNGDQAMEYLNGENSYAIANASRCRFWCCST